MSLGILGIPSGLTGYFKRLMEVLVQVRPTFELLESTSPFITIDELHLISSLGHLSRFSKQWEVCSCDENDALLKSLQDCTEILSAARVQLKFRPLQSNLYVS